MCSINLESDVVENFINKPELMIINEIKSIIDNLKYEHYLSLSGFGNWLVFYYCNKPYRILNVADDYITVAEIENGNFAFDNITTLFYKQLDLDDLSKLIKAIKLFFKI